MPKIRSSSLVLFIFILLAEFSYTLPFNEFQFVTSSSSSIELLSTAPTTSSPTGLSSNTNVPTPITTSSLTELISNANVPTPIATLSLIELFSNANVPTTTTTSNEFFSNSNETTSSFSKSQDASSVVKIATVFVGSLNFSGTATIKKLDLPSSYSLTNILLPTTNSKSPSTPTRSSRPVIHITRIHSETTQPTDLSNNIPSSAFSIKGYISLDIIFWSVITSFWVII